MTTHTINCNEFPFMKEANQSSMNIKQGTIELDFSKILLLGEESENNPLYQKLVSKLCKILTFTREEYQSQRFFFFEPLTPADGIKWIDNKATIHITPKNIALLLTSSDSAMPPEWRIALDTLKINANVLNYLLQHPDIIPMEWKKKSYIHFLGSNWMGDFPMLFKGSIEHDFEKAFHNASYAACQCESCAIALIIP